MRRFAEIAYSSLKTACFVAIGEGGGPRLLEKLTRVVASQLTKYADSIGEENEKKFMPIDVALDIDRLLIEIGKGPIITAQMAEQLGYRLDPISGAASSGELTEADALRVMDEAADYWKIARKAFEDGRIDALECRQMREKLWQITAACQIAIRKLNEMDFS